jgi:hypothetical protein
MRRRQIGLALSLILALGAVACSRSRGPGETAAEFIERLQDGDVEGAKELLAEDQWDNLSVVWREGVEITGYSIDEVELSQDGDRAEVRWNTEINDPNSRDSNEDGTWTLEKNSDGDWVIVDL